MSYEEIIVKGLSLLPNPEGAAAKLDKLIDQHYDSTIKKNKKTIVDHYKEDYKYHWDRVKTSEKNENGNSTKVGESFYAIKKHHFHSLIAMHPYGVYNLTKKESKKELKETRKGKGEKGYCDYHESIDYLADDSFNKLGPEFEKEWLTHKNNMAEVAKFRKIVNPPKKRKHDQQVSSGSELEKSQKLF